MNTPDHILQQIERALRKIVQKFSQEVENPPLTDIYLQVRQESGELLVYNDDDVELTRCVVEEWIGNTEENFYETIQPVIRKAIENQKESLENLPVLKPYSFVLMDEERETVAELYLVDDETILLDGELMKGLGEDLDLFWEKLSGK